MNLKEIKAAAIKAFIDQQTQDTEGGVPNAVSFCAGFLAGARYRQDEIEVWENNYNELEEQNAKLKEALEFYADKNNWVGYHYYVDYMPGDTEPAKASDGFDIRLGGKLARQVLKQLFGKTE